MSRQTIPMIIFCGKWLLMFACVATSTATLAAGEIVVDFLMDREPLEKAQPESWYLHPDSVSLWKQALTHPESELKRQAAEAIGQAYQLGHVEAASAVPELLSVLADPKNHPAARHAAAHALIMLDQKSSAAALLEALPTGGKDLRLLVEPALAKWHFEAIRPIWRQRLASPAVHRRELVLALSGLAELQDAESLPAVLEMARTTKNPADMRLAAARAASRIANQGLEETAQLLGSQNQAAVVDRLCAAVLVAHHRSDSAIALLQKLGGDSNHAVAGEALQSLYTTDPKLVLPLLDSALKSEDSNIRRIGVKVCISEPTLERIGLLASSLNDAHPDLRTMAGQGLLQLTKETSFDLEVRKRTIEILAGDDWRGQEQAALVLGALDEEAAVPRLLELIETVRPEVTVAAAWSLKSLEVAESSAPVIAFATRLTEMPVKATVAMDHRLAHLFELLGRLKSADAIPLLRRYIPKGEFAPNSRGAAVWALGLIMEGQTDDALAAQLMERALDTFSIPPEEYPVRHASLLSIGRLQAKAQVPGLKKLIGDRVDNENIELTARWAILRISGEDLPIGTVPSRRRVGWFLEPAVDSK